MDNKLKAFLIGGIWLVCTIVTFIGKSTEPLWIALIGTAIIDRMV